METPGNLVDSPTHQCGESIFELWISPRIRSQNRNGLKGSVRDLGQSDLCKNIEKTGSSPCPYNGGHEPDENVKSTLTIKDSNQWWMVFFVFQPSRIKKIYATQYLHIYCTWEIWKT